MNEDIKISEVDGVNKKTIKRKVSVASTSSANKPTRSSPRKI